MKYVKRIRYLSFLLAFLTLLSACGASRQGMLNEIPVKDTPYTDSVPTLTSMEALPSDFSKTSIEHSACDLVCFRQKNKRIVYNLTTNSAVWSEDIVNTRETYVSLKTMYFGLDSVAYFIVKSEELKPETLERTGNCTTTLYSATGERIAHVDKDIDLTSYVDLLYFDGTFYRVGEDGSITFAVEYPLTARIPDIHKVHNGIYYETNASFVATYDSELKLFMKHHYPVSDRDDDAEITCYSILENGDVFYQCRYEADPNAEEYDYLSDGVKYRLVTRTVDAKTGKVKELNCSYLLQSVHNSIQNSANDVGLDLKKLFVYGEATRIEDRRLLGTCTVMVDNRGKLNELRTMDGDRVENIRFVDDNRWLVTTEYGKCLIDASGTVIGDVTNATRNGRFFYVDGKIFDSSLNLLYDCEANGQTIKRQVGDSMLLEDRDGRLLLYTGSGDPIVLIDKDSTKTETEVTTQYGCVVLQDGQRIEVYNKLGVLLGTAEGNVNSQSIIKHFRGILLLRITNASEGNVLYRLS